MITAAHARLLWTVGLAMGIVIGVGLTLLVNWFRGK